MQYEAKGDAQIMCRGKGARCIIPENQYLVDNAVMIGVLGIKMHNAGNQTKLENSRINPYERTDDVAVNWR